MALAPIGLLAWEPPYASGLALKKTKKKKEKKKISVVKNVIAYWINFIFVASRAQL